MSKVIKQFFKYDKVDQLILFWLLVFSGVLVFLYWQKDTLSVYDASGHVAAVEVVRGFWPAFSGWNAKELFGYPQGVFYPSLFHYLAATTSFLTGVQTAIKILISFAFILLPISLFTFASALTKDKVWSAIITIALFILLLLFPNFLGTGVRSLFQVGLISNFFVLPIFFFFLAFLHKDEINKYWLILSILFSLIILTHLVAAIAAGFYFLIYIASGFLVVKKTGLRAYVKVIIFAAALTAFFWLPFVLHFDLTSVSRHVSSYFFPNLAVLFAAVLLLIYAWQRKQTSILALSGFAAIFSILASIDAFLIRESGTSFFLYPSHIYRFQPFTYLFVTCALIIAMSKYITLRPKSQSLWAAPLTGLVLALVAVLIKNPADLPKANVELDKPETVSGRFIESFRRTEVDPFWYSIQASLVEKDFQSQWAYGLFTDSSPNGPYLGSLIKSLRPCAYPKDEETFIETKTVDQQKVFPLLDLFGINYLINLDGHEADAIGTWKVGGETKFYTAEKVNDAALFEITNLKLVAVKNDWEKAVEYWWTEKGTLKDLPYLVNGKSEIAEVSKYDLKNSKVQIINSNKKQTQFRLNIDSDNSVPVLAKISYFPYWHAFDKSGEEIPIYRAAPNLMLISAKGEITLEYKEPFYVMVLYLLSAITFLFIFTRLAILKTRR